MDFDMTSAPAPKEILSAFRGQESPRKVFDNFGIVGQLRKTQILRIDMDDVIILCIFHSASLKAVGDQHGVRGLHRKASMSASIHTTVGPFDFLAMRLRARH